MRPDDEMVRAGWWLESSYEQRFMAAQHQGELEQDGLTIRLRRSIDPDGYVRWNVWQRKSNV